MTRETRASDMAKVGDDELLVGGTMEEVGLFFCASVFHYIRLEWKTASTTSFDLPHLKNQIRKPELQDACTKYTVPGNSMDFGIVLRGGEIHLLNNRNISSRSLA